MYLENAVFPSFGNWQVRSLAFDNCGGYSESQSQVTYNDPAKTNPNPIGVIISANPIS
jgi:hypothetical protein